MLLAAGLCFLLVLFPEAFEGWSAVRAAKREARRAAMSKWELRFRLLRNLAMFAFIIAWVHHLFT
jgi:hypothetical protein